MEPPSTGEVREIRQSVRVPGVRRVGRGEDPDRWSPQRKALKRADSRRRMFKRWGTPAPRVPAAEFMTRQEAATALGANTPATVPLLVARGILEPAFTRDGAEGVTRRSVEAELK